MSFRDRKNRAQYAFVPGQPVVFTLPKGGKILSGKIILKGNLVVSGGSANGTAVDLGSPYGLIRRIEVTANRLATSKYPGGKIVDCTPKALLEYAITQRSGKWSGELLGTNMAAGAAGTYAIYLSIPIFFADPVQKAQMQTALNADEGVYQSIQVTVYTASDYTGCFTGNDRSIATSSLMVQWRDDRLGLPGDTMPLYQEDHIFQIAAANERAQDTSLPQDGAFTSLLVMAEAGTSRALSDAILNKVVLEGPSVQFNEYGLDIRQQMVDDEWLDPATTATGLYFIDFTDGWQQYNRCLAPGLLNQWDLNNPSGANADELRIYTRRVFDLPPSA